MNFIATSKALTKSDIFDAEKEMGILFPKDFIAHYLQFNGGCAENDKYVWKDGGETRVNSFFPLKYDDLGKIETIYRDLFILENYLPEGIVPFATDDGGNFFCISARMQDYGNVYYFNNDHYDVENEHSAMEYLENTFSDFIENLK